jgi:hypothetical protein
MAVVLATVAVVGLRFALLVPELLERVCAVEGIKTRCGGRKTGEVWVYIPADNHE